jgi:hypothetical protein
MSEAPAGASVDEELPNILYSPSGSATTGFSGGSSLGLQYKGAWCTPPRVFVDYQVLKSSNAFISCVSLITNVLVLAKNPAEAFNLVSCHLVLAKEFSARFIYELMEV